MALRKNRSPMLCWHPPQVSREGGIWRTSSTGSLHNTQHRLGQQILYCCHWSVPFMSILQFEAVHLREPLDVVKVSTALWRQNKRQFLKTPFHLSFPRPVRTSSSSTRTGGTTDHSVCTCFFIEKLQTLSVASTIHQNYSSDVLQIFWVILTLN